MENFENSFNAFLGVHFVLFGFDPVHKREVRSKLVNGGGVDVGRYGQNCTHVVVDKLVYDDPVCVAARNDGKMLVTSLWVDHSFDTGMPVPESIMYRPLKGLNGIPGAESLVACLTGYHGQDRDDVMTMVGLMGAQFSKPLVASKVTHLVCYKFEGEKYELAKKLKTIKLVNHRWLEDCLKAWKILPEDNYAMSGYELEMLEAEAKDSEEEGAPMKQSDGRIMNKSPYKLQIGTPKVHELPISAGEVPKTPQDSTRPKGLLNVINVDGMLSATGRDARSNQASSMNKVNIKHPEGIACQEIGATKDTACGELSENCDRTPVSANLRNGLALPSISAKKSPHSEEKLNLLSYSRKTPRRNSLPTCLGENSSNATGSPKLDIVTLKVNGSFNISPSRVEEAKNGADSDSVKTPSKGTKQPHEEILSEVLPQKRKTDVSCAISKSQKRRQDSELGISGSPLAGNRTPGLESSSLINGPIQINNCSLFTNNGSPTAVLNSGGNSAPHSSTKSLTLDMLISKTVTSESGQDRNVGEKVAQTSFGRLGKPNLATKPETGDSNIHGTPQVIGETREPQNQEQGGKVSSPSSKSTNIEKSHSPGLGLIKGDNDNSHSKPVRTKMLAKKSLGSRPRLSANKSVNQKGSIFSNKTVAEDAAAIETTSGPKFSSASRVELVSQTVNVEAARQLVTENVLTSADKVENKNESVEDETEAPDDENEFVRAVNEKSEVVELTNKAGKVMKERSEQVQHRTNNTKANILNPHDDGMGSQEDKNEPETEKAVCGNPGESTIKSDGAKEKMAKGNRSTLGRTKRKTVPAVLETMESEKDVDGGEAQTEKNVKKAEKENRVPDSAGKTSANTKPVMKLKNSIEIEKENKPIGDGDRNTSQRKQQTGKSAIASNRAPVMTTKNFAKIDADLTPVGKASNILKTEPAWFILSGHKLQRKEFQQVIKRLKGRSCRDSHHWSYQATHFIVPDPIRRTEKFFAAAAAGRWILKTDYLTASSQAGKFLAEEPYEWHKNGLSEDGAINLEAPRKWRLLRERTGHGAFYGMHIIIYGECIAPPLDTLKRVVKAGDGTILATSPPYTRFLKSGVDFAIVSPGMPRVDLWVQEFLRHEIPCVVPDYLVEYVCKPGYSLERHVQYNTHAWAEKSFANLINRSEEIVEDLANLTPPDNQDINDLNCEVCGSHERGEVMLICGNESGSIGCGVGTHIDCCDPPLTEVPEEDWFCPKCRGSINRINPPKRTKKGNSLKK